MDPSTELLLNQFVGRMHPLVVHFPVALLILAGLLEVFRRRERPSDAALICLIVGSLGAVVAAYSGWQFFEHDGPGPSRTMWLHRWGGVTVASLSFVCVVLGLLARRGTRPKVMSFFRGGVVLCMVLTAFVAHQGGESVWGDGFLFDVFEEEELVEEAPGESELVLPEDRDRLRSARTPETPAPYTVDYRLRGSDGTTISVSESGAPRFAAETRFAGLFAGLKIIHICQGALALFFLKFAEPDKFYA